MKAYDGKKQFFRQLKEAKLLVPYQGDTMNVAALHNSAGEILLPAFTSPYELTREHTAWDNIGVMTLVLSPLKSYPSGIVEALRSFFEKNQEVTRAWLLAERPDYKTPPHKLFVIEFFGDRRLLFPQVAKVVEPFMRPGESFELMKADRALAKKAREKAAPIYVCK